MDVLTKKLMEMPIPDIHGKESGVEYSVIGLVGFFFFFFDVRLVESMTRRLKARHDSYIVLFRGL